jgi:glycosyltransferase involved in cell wall biosynthesis
MPQLSVIIPTYQRRDLVCEAVDSVLSQETGRPIEIIVVDDGSDDGTGDVLRKYGDRIRYFYQPNKGINCARNRGIREARGEFIALLDSDDVWLPFKTELQLSLMERFPQAGFCFSNFYAWRGPERSPDGLGRWMAGGRTVSDAIVQSFSSADLGLAAAHPQLEVGRCDIYHLSLFQPVVLPSTSIVRREVMEALGPLPEDNWMCGDWEYFARASRQFGALYVGLETTLNRSHDDPVRLMRRDLSDRTLQRIASIRRTWKADRDFMTRFATEVHRVEAAEVTTLVKRACYQGRHREARQHLGELRALEQAPRWSLVLLYWATRVPAVRAGLDRLRQGLRGD